MVWDADCPELEIVHVNEAPGVLESSAYLLEFDSVHGRWQAGKVESSDADNTMTIDGKVVTYSMHTQVTVPAVAWS
jgi:glyceraldehyde 3-phosphate dehydrogenase